MKRVLLVLGFALMLWSLPILSAKADETSRNDSEGSATAQKPVVIDLTEIPAWVELGTASGESNNRLTYISSIAAELHITPEGVATVYADAYSFSDLLTNLLVVAELQQLVNGNWTTIVTYRCFTGESYAVISETWDVARGYYYRVKNTTTAYAGSDSETVTATTGEWNFYVPGT